jgi:hypothetical protein
MKKKLSYDQQVKQEEDYIAFLRKRLDSANYKANVSAEEYSTTQTKYERAKFRLKTLKMGKNK